MWWRIIRTAARLWLQHRSARLGAALAYYSVFAAGPVLLIVTAVAGALFGGTAVRASLSTELQGLIGPAGSGAVEALLAGASSPATGGIAVMFGVAFLIVGAVAFAAQLKDGMNTIWNVEGAIHPSVWWYVRNYVVSTAEVLALGLFVAASVVVSTWIVAAPTFSGNALSDSGSLQILDVLASLLIASALFAALFKFFPDAAVDWGDVVVGGIVTGVLFEVGKAILGWYIGSRGLESTYGAVGSILALLIWVYYSAQIVLIGAEITHAYAAERGSRREAGLTARNPHEASRQ